MMRRVLHYRIESEIGAGGMGRVFLAHDERTDRRVALKFLYPTGDNAEARAGLIREARAAARLSHSGIVTLHAIEDTGTELFLVQEYVKGESLATRLARGPLSVPETLRLARELAGALGHAHKNGVLHRDLKPDNVLMSPDGQFKIADFGIARLEDTTTLAAADLQAGTLAYMAPERLSGDPGDARSDLFALGAILYEALAGQRAFTGRTSAELLVQILNASPPPLSLPGEQGPALARLVERLLARDPGARPSGAEMLLGVLDGLESATPTTPLPTLAAAPARGRPAPTRGQLVGGLLLGALAIAILVFVLGRGGPDAAARVAPVAVLYFENLADPADSERVGAITGNLIITSLAQAGDIDVLSSQAVLDALAQLGKPGTRVDREMAMAVARRVHAGRIVTGSILQTTPRLVFTTEITDVTSGRVLQADRIEGQPGQTVFDLVDEMGGRLAARLSPAGEGARRLDPVATRASGDLVAMRRYVEGIDALAVGDAAGARDAFRGAVTADSTFAQAWFRLAISQWWTGEPQEAREDVERARRYQERLSPAEREVLDGIRELISYDYPAAARRFAELARRFPDDALVHYGHLEGTFHDEKYAEAVEAARRTLALNPRFELANLHLAEAQAALGQSAQAESTLSALMDQHPGSAPFATSLAALQSRSGRGAAALATYQRALAGGIPRFPHAPMAAFMAIGLDSLELADRLWRDDDVPAPLRRDMRLGYDCLRAQYEGRLAEAMRLALIGAREFGRLPAGIAPTALADGMSAALALGDETRAQLFADSVAVQLARWDPESYGPFVGVLRAQVDLRFGRLDRARGRLEALQSRVPRGSSTRSVVLDFVWAEWWLAAGEPDSTLRLLPGSIPPVAPETRRSTSLQLQVSALAALGRTAEALAVLDTLQGAPWLPPVEVVRLHPLRGRLLEQLNRPAEARAAYERFLRIWAKADPDAPDLKEARAAVRRLGGAG